MKPSFCTLRLAIVLLILLVPLQAHAGGAEIRAIFIGLINVYAPIWIPIAILVTTIIGFTLMLSQDEASLDKARTALTAVFIGGVTTVILLWFGVGTVISWIYDGSSDTGLLGGSLNFGLQAVGVAAWIETIAVVAGVLTVIIAATKAVFSFGDEAQYGNVRTSILHVIIGLLVIGGAGIFQSVFFVTPREPGILLAYFLTPIKALITIVGFLVVFIIIYAGFRMIISFGKEDEFTAARSLIFRALIGLVILLIAFTLISVVQSCFTGPCIA